MDINTAIMQALASTTSQTPQTFRSLADRVEAIRPETQPDEFTTALESLCDASKIKTFRAERGGQWLNLYWPAGQTIGDSMSKPQNGATTLMKNILMHGPITGTKLAGKTGILARNIGTILARGKAEFEVRYGYDPEAGQQVKHYCTRLQAEQWDEDSAAAQSAENVAADGSEDAAPDLPAQIAAMKTREHELLNDIAAANLIFEQIAQKLQVKKAEQIPEALDGLITAVPLAMESINSGAGRIALVLWYDQDVQIEYVHQLSSQTEAADIALDRVKTGGADHCMLIRVLGEARKNVEWVDVG